MIEFGKTLQRTREAKGLTVTQIGEMTNLAPSTVTELETEDFSRIAAPIYGRGFVKLYCEALGVDAKPFIEEFMAIYNGERNVTVKERDIGSAPKPTTEPDPVPAPEPTSAPTPAPAPEPSPEPAPTTESAPADAEKPVPAPEPAQEPDLFNQPLATESTPSAEPTEQAFSRYASPLTPSQDDPRRYTDGGYGIFSFWRVGVLGVATLVLIVLLIFGMRALYRATSVDAENDTEISTPAPTAEQQPIAAKQPTAPLPQKAKTGATVKRTPQKIPSLYID